MQYRRADVAGGTYFFTVNLAERSLTLLVDHVDVLRTAMREVKAKHPFRIGAMVDGDSAGSFACVVDASGRRLRLSHALDVGQGGVFTPRVSDVT